MVLDCGINDDGLTWNALIGTCGEIMKVGSLKTSHKSCDCEIGHVTSVLTEDAVVNHSTWISLTISTIPLVMDEKYEYEAIETQMMVEDRIIAWRATNVLKKEYV